MLSGKEKYLFGDIDDCELCPFFYLNEKSPYDTMFICSGSPDYWKPCDSMDEYAKMTLSEVVDVVNDVQRTREKRWSDISREKELKRKKQEEATKKGKATRNENFFINREITRLRKLIRERERSIASMLSIVNAHAITKAMMNGESFKNIEISEDDIPTIVKWKQDNIKDREELEKLILKRKQRNKERNKKKDN